MRTLPLILLLAACSTDPPVRPAPRRTPVAQRAPAALLNRGGDLTISPTTSAVDPARGVVLVEYTSAAALFSAASGLADPCARKSALSLIPRGGLLAIRAAFPPARGSVAPGQPGRFRVKVRMEGRVVARAASPAAGARWNTAHPALGALSQVSFSVPLLREVRSDLTVMILDKATDRVSLFTLSGTDAMLEKNAAVLPRLRDAVGCTPAAAQKALAYKGKAATVSPALTSSQGLFAAVTGYHGLPESLKQMESFVDRVEGAQSVLQIPSSQPAWHTIELALTAGMAERCKVSLFNVLASQITVARRAARPGAPLPVDRVSVSISRNIPVPLVLDVQCPGLTGRITLTPGMDANTLMPLVTRLKKQTTRATSRALTAGSKLRKGKKPFEERFGAARLLKEQHYQLTKILIDLLIMEHLFSRHQGSQADLTALKKSVYTLSRAHGYHVRSLYYTVRNDYYREHGAMPGASNRYKIIVPSYCTQNLTAAQRRSVKRICDMYERRRAQEERRNAAFAEIQELGKTHSFSKDFNVLAEAVLKAEAPAKDTSRSY